VSWLKKGLYYAYLPVVLYIGYKTVKMDHILNPGPM
jgi:hypothetical protein